MVKGAVGVCTVTVVLTVIDVLLGGVRDKIAHREAIVSSHKVDAGQRATLGGERVARTGKSGRKAAYPRGSGAGAAGIINVAEPEVTNTVAVPIVPLLPAVTEVSGLPSADSHIPRLGNELGVCQHRISQDRLQQRVLCREGMRFVSSERSRKIK